MRERTYDEEAEYSWIVYVAAVLLVGAVTGYLITTTTSREASAAPASPAAAAADVAGVPPADEATVQAYRSILARDPRNLQAAVGLANLLYDARRYAEAIPFYQQAFALDSHDINVSTDLGTALWYTGRADEALRQYDKSLAIDPTHAQTLFNVGIVQSEGRHDRAAAVKAWETLLAAHPDYPGAARVRQLLADARK